jgi:hypothetical protein
MVGDLDLSAAQSLQGFDKERIVFPMNRGGGVFVGHVKLIGFGHGVAGAQEKN